MDISLKEFIWVAGVVQLFIASANFVLPSMLHYRENLEKVAPIIRQIFHVHCFFIVLVLLGFAAICFGYPDELCGKTSLGRFMSGFLALFWLLRVAIQFVYYDSSIKRQNRLGNFVFTVSFIYLAAVFTAAFLFAK